MTRVVKIALLAGVSVGCIETIEVDYVRDDQLFVIAGRITDTKPAVVEITRSATSSVSSREDVERVFAATVTLSDDQGNREQLTEQSPGFFTGAAPGQVGTSYTLEVLLSDGTEITSSPELLKASPSIDSLYTENVSGFRELERNIQLDNSGLNLNLYLSRTDTSAQYYRWTVGGTYESYTAYNSPGSECVNIFSEVDLQPCYITLPETSYFVVDESQKSGADEFAINLKFLRPNSQFAFGHSVLVTQYSLTKEAYTYWKRVDDQARSVGSIFDPPPTQIEGNLKVSGHTDKRVLGLFEANSVKTRRVFIQRSDFETVDEDSPAFSERGINAPCFDLWTGDAKPYDYCCDCSFHQNSTRVKPDYWQ